MQVPLLDDDIREQAAQHTMAANPLVGVRGQDVLDLGTPAARADAQPSRRSRAAVSGVPRSSSAHRDWRQRACARRQDRRFADPAWKESAAYRALAQGYLAWGNALHRFLDDAKLDKRDAERARFVVSLFVDALSPTNSLAGNPAALKKPSTPAARASCMGWRISSATCAQRRPAGTGRHRNSPSARTATTPGSVVYRTPVMELIQYRPMTRGARRPLLIAPPQINKFYVFDLAPEKSIVQYCLNGGLQTFAISWKNPTPADSHFGIDTYVAALEEAVDAMRDITGSADVNIWGSCSGGITMSAFLAHPGAAKPRFTAPPWRSACSTWRYKNTTAGMFVTPNRSCAAKSRHIVASSRSWTRHVRLDGQRPDLELLGEQLSARQRAACVSMSFSTGTTTRPGCPHGCMTDSHLDLIRRQSVRVLQARSACTPLDMRRST